MYRNERIQNAGSMLQHLAGSFCRAISESLSLSLSLSLSSCLLDFTTLLSFVNKCSKYLYNDYVTKKF